MNVPRKADSWPPVRWEAGNRPGTGAPAPLRGCAVDRYREDVKRDMEWCRLCRDCANAGSVQGTHSVLAYRWARVQHGLLYPAIRTGLRSPASAHTTRRMRGRYPLVRRRHNTAYPLHLLGGSHVAKPRLYVVCVIVIMGLCPLCQGTMQVLHCLAV